MDEATLRAYDPSWRERLVNLIMGDSRPSPERRRFAEGIGSLAGFTPAGIPLAANEMQRARGAGDPTGAALAAFGMLPMPAGRAVATTAREVALRKAAAEAPVVVRPAARAAEEAPIYADFREIPGLAGPRAPPPSAPAMLERGYTPPAWDMRYAAPAEARVMPAAAAGNVAVSKGVSNVLPANPFLRFGVPMAGAGMGAAGLAMLGNPEAPARTVAPRQYVDGNPDMTGQSVTGSPAVPAATAPVAAGPPMQFRREAPVPTPPVREVVAAPPARASILDRIFSGEDYQSADPRNARPNMPSPLRRADNSINWGDSELASDFFRADRADRAARGYASGGGVNAERSSALLKALDIIDRLTQRR